jgi:hypothetical protein
MTLALRNYHGEYSTTSATSTQGQFFGRIRTPANAIVRNLSAPQPTIEERLSNALTQAKTVIAHGVRDLGEERARDFRARLTELLNPEDWDDDDAILQAASTQTMIKAVIATGSPALGLTLTSTGNLISTWTVDGRTVRIEALPSGQVSWAIIDKQGDKLIPRHSNADSVTGLQAALQA